MHLIYSRQQIFDEKKPERRLTPIDALWGMRQNLIFNDKTIASRLQDVHVKRTQAASHIFDEDFKQKVEQEVDHFIQNARSMPSHCWAVEEYNADNTLHETKAALDQTKPNSSPGPDQVHPKMIKNSGQTMVIALQLLIQLCWNAALFPLSFKKQNMIYLQKPDKPSYNTENPIDPSR